MESQSQSHFHGYFNLICPHCLALTRVHERHIMCPISCSNCTLIIYYPTPAQTEDIETACNECTTTAQQYDDYGE